jgi:hypothetical protein
MSHLHQQFPFHGNGLFLQAQTKVLHPQDRGIVTKVIMLGPGTQQASICKPSAAQPIQETAKQTPF